MKRSTRAALVLGAYTAAAATAMISMISPGRPDRETRERYTGRAFAHRGLYSADQTVPENSLPAFEKACTAGCGIELDVQLSADGKVVVFHDDDLKRVCGVDRRVDEMEYVRLRRLRLFHTDEQIPLFSSVLDLIDGRAPLLVELKTGKHNAELCEKTLAMLENYDGEWCIESFDPRIVAWFRLHAPYVLRGQLAQPPEYYEKEGYSSAAGTLLGNTMLNFLAKPQFIAYRVGRRPLPIRIASAMGAMMFGWTVKMSSDITSSGEKWDAVIFEEQ